MSTNVTPATLEAIQPLRLMFLHEGNFQFIHNSYHARKWASSYLLHVGEAVVGYGSICGSNGNWDERDTVFEFYVMPPFRNKAVALFEELLTVSKARYIDCQTNDKLITQMLYTVAKNINGEAILFEDKTATTLACTDALFRRKAAADKIFEHKAEPEGDYVMEKNGEIIATGGFLLHYNMPYADLYMEVAEPYRRKGYGSFLIQEIKKACYLANRVPAARTGVDNFASRATLLGAGFAVCGHLVKGEVKA